MPRSRILRPLITLGVTDLSYAFLPANDGREREEVADAKWGWRSWYALEKACRVEGQCLQRGCENTADSQCTACKAAQYCGAICQKKFVHLPFHVSLSHTRDLTA